MQVKINLLSPNAVVPKKGTVGAAGYDLFAAETALVSRLTRKLIKTNISIEIPSGYYARIAPRSGLAFKNGIDVMAGVIDSDYRGDVGVILYNTDPQKDFSVRPGDRIAQLIIESCFDAEWIQGDLSESQRGENGYGHTG